MEDSKTLAEMYFYDLLRIEYNVYSELFKFYIQTDPFKIHIRFLAYFERNIFKDEPKKIVADYTFTYDEIKKLIELPEIGSSMAIQLTLEILNNKILEILKSLEKHGIDLFGYRLNREVSIGIMQNFKS